MSYQTSQTWTGLISVVDPETGEPINADSLPLVTLRVGAADVADAVSVSAEGVGVYFVSAPLASRTVGEVVLPYATVSVDGVSYAYAWPAIVVVPTESTGSNFISLLNDKLLLQLAGRPNTVSLRLRNTAGQYYDFNPASLGFVDPDANAQFPVTLTVGVAGSGGTVGQTDPTFSFAALDTATVPSGRYLVQVVEDATWDASTLAAVEVYWDGTALSRVEVDSRLQGSGDLPTVDDVAVGQTTPINQEPVGLGRKARMVRRKGGLVSEKIDLDLADTGALLSADFASDLPRNGRISEVVSATTTPGLTVAIAGADHSEAKITATPTAAGEYDVALRVRYSNQGGTHTGRLRIRVA